MTDCIHPERRYTGDPLDPDGCERSCCLPVYMRPLKRSSPGVQRVKGKSDSEENLCLLDQQMYNASYAVQQVERLQEVVQLLLQLFTRNTNKNP